MRQVGVSPAHLERWMDDGGIMLDRRGPEFEKFVRNALLSAAENSPLFGTLTVLPAGVKLTSSDGRKGQIDVVIFLHNVVLLVEVKCCLWPEDAIEFADYRNKIDEATRQARRHMNAVRADYHGFGEKIRGMGRLIPESPLLLACVLTNTATLAGTCMNGISVVDLPLLEDFLRGEYVESELWDGDQLDGSGAAPDRMVGSRQSWTRSQAIRGIPERARSETLLKP